MKEYQDLPQFARDFLVYMETIKGKSKLTVNEYYYDLRTFLRFLSHYKLLSDDPIEEISIENFPVEILNEVQLSDLYEFLSYVSRERHNKANSRARKIACIRSFFKYLNVKANLISSNPAKELESPKATKSLPKYLQFDECIRLLNVIDGEYKERDYAMILLFLTCGLRLSELVGINISDIKKDKLVVLGKGNKERTIYLSRNCVEAIDEYLKVRPKDGVTDQKALFLSKQKKRISNNMVYRIVKKYLEDAGLDTTKYSVHKLRHTAATLMYQQGGVDVRLLQEILGHTNLSTTEIYTHLDEKQLRSAIEKNPLSKLQ